MSVACAVVVNNGLSALLTASGVYSARVHHVQTPILHGWLGGVVVRALDS